MLQYEMSAEEASQVVAEGLTEEFLAGLEVLTRVTTPKPGTPPEEVMWGFAQRELYERLRNIHQNHVQRTETA